MASQPIPPRFGHHLRRPPANKSVSLMHAPSNLASTDTSEKPKRNHVPIASLQAKPPRSQKGSSGESSNAEKWFEASNNNVQNASASLVDNDPPFLLRNSSSSSQSPEGRSRRRLHTSHPRPPSSLPLRAGLIHMPTGASSSEDYRSVIDDLTVENKKLKRRLRQYERFQNPELQNDKVVELRTFNVPADKKRELEDILKKFTMSLEEARAENLSGNGLEKAGASLHPQKTTSSHTSTRFGDSAYASMSASGNHSSAQSGQSTSYRNLATAASALGFRHQQHQNVRSYLQDIPAGLLPKSGPVAMTERSKRKMVVRRLEQIFAGKAPTMGGHQQPLQQQEVAQSAAKADRKAIEDSGRRALEEGCREAQIMSEADGSGGGETGTLSNDESSHVEVKPPAQRELLHDTAEQRPTRPLDLDPFRAQVPADNIKYIRHLGFSPPDAESIESQADGHGWIYLNLLINMAQLHTLNVTAEFVRKSIAEFSDKLELSHEGRKVRWKGGTEVTRTSSDSSPEDDHGRPDRSSYLKVEPRKRSKLATAISSNGSSERLSKSNRTSSNNKLAYTPLFFRKPDSDADYMSDYNVSSWTSPRAAPAGDSSGLAGSGRRAASSRRRRGDDGAIIFYNRAGFCTDLSGDPKFRNRPSSNSPNYRRLVTVPVGDSDGISGFSDEALEKKGPLSLPQVIGAEATPTDNSQSPSDVEMEVNSMKQASVEASSSEESLEPIEFEVSGIGGVVPADNFTIQVRARRKLERGTSGPVGPVRVGRGKKYPSNIRHILTQSCSDLTVSPPTVNKPVFREQVISERRKDLPPSELPPPSFFPFASPYTDGEGGSSDSEADGDGLSDSAAALAAVHHPLPSVVPQQMGWAVDASGDESLSSEEDDENESMEVGDSDVSLDLLATARQVDPIMVLAKEREYDSQMPDRLAEEIPAGSSAATAGGGSGFSSPNPHHDSANGKVSRRLSLKRARPSESMIVQPGRPINSPRLED